MIRFTIKVPNHDNGFDLGEFDAGACPHTGASIARPRKDR